MLLYIHTHIQQIYVTFVISYFIFFHIVFLNKSEIKAIWVTLTYEKAY